MSTQELNAVRAVNAPTQVLPGWTHDFPCSEGLHWLREAGIKTTAEAWDKCQNSQWMLWALRQIGYQDSRALRLFACSCVRHTPLGDGRVVWDLLTDERSRAAVEVAERYAQGNATEYERQAAEAAAREAAWAAAREAVWAAGRAAAREAAWAAWAAAGGSADAVAWAAREAAEEAARAAAKAAAKAAVEAAGRAAGAAAWAAAWAAEADQLRRMVPNPFADIATATSRSLG